MKKAEYLEMRKRLKEKYRDDVAKLDAVFAMFGGSPVSDKASAQSTSSNSNSWSHDVSKRDAVRDTLKKMEVSQFTLKDVHAALATHFPDMAADIGMNQLSAILSILANKKKEIAVVRSKVGKSPAIYKLAGDQ